MGTIFPWLQWVLWNGVSLLFLSLLVKSKPKPVFSLMTNRKIWEDEISSRVRTIQVRHTRNRNTRQNWGWSWSRHSSSLSNGACLFKCSEKEKVGVMRKGSTIISQVCTAQNHIYSTYTSVFSCPSNNLNSTTGGGSTGLRSACAIPVD